MEPHILTIIGVKLTKNTSTIYITVHRGCSLRTTTGRQEKIASTILHYKINAVRKTSPPMVGVPAGQHLRHRLSELLSLDQDTQFVHLPLADAFRNLNTFMENKYNTTSWLLEQDSLGNVVEGKSIKGCIFPQEESNTTTQLSFTVKNSNFRLHLISQRCDLYLYIHTGSEALSYLVASSLLH